MKKSRDDYISDLIKADRVLQTFMIPAGKKFRAEKGFDVHKWAQETPPVMKQFEYMQHPECNLGASCVNMVVVDLDVKVKKYQGEERAQEGYATWKRWCAGREGIKTWVSHTPSGGVHIFFRLDTLSPELAEKYSGKLKATCSLEHPFSGVDIRTGRTHVVLPGSKTDDGAYEWDEKMNPYRVKLAEAPEWLLSKVACGSHHDRKTREVVKHFRGKHRPPESFGEISDARNNALFYAGRRWVFEAKTRILMGEITQEEGARFVWDMMNELNRVGTADNPLPNSEISKCYRSVMSVAKKDWELVPHEKVKVVCREFPGGTVEEVRRDN